MKAPGLLLLALCYLSSQNGFAQIEGKNYVYISVNIGAKKNYAAYLLPNTGGEVHQLADYRGATDSLLIEDSANLFISLKSPDNLTVYNYIKLLENDSVLISDKGQMVEVMIKNRKVNTQEINFPFQLNSRFMGLDLNMEKQVELKIKTDADTMRLAKMYRQSLFFLDSLKEKGLISMTFYKTKKIEFDCNFHKLMLAANNQRQLSRTEIFINSVAEDPDYVSALPYAELCRSYVLLVYKKESGGINEEADFQHFVDEKFPGKVGKRIINLSMGGYMAFSRESLSSKKNTLQTYLNITQDSANYLRYMKLLTVPEKKDLNNTLDSLQDALGNYSTLESVLYKKTDKLVLVDLWASWCAPCLHAMPDVIKLQQAYGDKLDVIFISTDENSNSWKNKYHAFGLAAIKHNYRIKDAANSAFFKQINLTSIPRYVLIHQGEIVNMDAPSPTKGALSKMIGDMLKK